MPSKCLASGLVHFGKGKRRPAFGHAVREKKRARPCPQGAQSWAEEVRQGLYTNTSQAKSAIFLTIPKHVCLFLALYLSLKKRLPENKFAECSRVCLPNQI